MENIFLSLSLFFIFDAEIVMAHLREFLMQKAGFF